MALLPHVGCLVTPAWLVDRSAGPDLAALYFVILLLGLLSGMVAYPLSFLKFERERRVEIVFTARRRGKEYERRVTVTAKEH